MSAVESMAQHGGAGSGPSSLRSSGPASKGAAGSIRVLAADIKLHHSVFALPFAVLGSFMAAVPSGDAIEWRPFAGQLSLVVLAMGTARTAAMLSNRLLDRDVDARNPRTVRRALPSGRSSSAAATSALAISIAGFMLVCAGFGVFFRNWWPISLGLPVLGWISLYPLAKRFTALCHLWLGSSLALSPLAAAIAVDPGSLAQPSLWLVALMVLGWVGGFDIIYALQDVEIDRAQRLHSMPANLGESGAMWISRGLHLFAAASLFAVLKVDDRFGSLFLAGAGLVAMLLAIEHLTVSRWGTSRMALSFFTLNGVISCVVGALGVSDLLKL